MGTHPRDDRWLPLLLAAIGFFVSAILEYLHVRAWHTPSASSFCTVSKAADCTAVALSNWSSVAGVPLPIWGMAGFLFIAVAVLRRSVWLLPLSVLAAVASLALLAIELVAIGSICLFCEVVHVASWALVIVAWLGRAKLTGPHRDPGLLAFGAAPAGGILLVTLIAVPPYWRVPTWNGPIPLPTGLTDDGHHWIGSRDPVLTIDEYVDYACPHCSVASQATLRALAKHASKVRLVRHNNPRMTCSATIPSSCMPLRAAICAGKQDRFWQMDRWLFANFDKGQVNLEAAAREVNLDLPTLRVCFDAPETFERANAEYIEASKAHILETPSYRIGGKGTKINEVFERLNATH